VIEWLGFFLLTIAIEIPIAVALAPRTARRSIALDALLANLATHPAAWFAMAHLQLDWNAIELLVAAVECGVYALVTALRWPRAALIALVANGVTAALSFAF
jgi:hypothetical protein